MKKIKKIISLMIIILFINMFFISIPIYKNPSASIMTFTLSDSFEDTINNRIYSYSQNITVGTNVLILEPISDTATIQLDNNDHNGINDYSYVDEYPTGDEGTTWVRNDGSVTFDWQYDLYYIENNGEETETITNVAFISNNKGMGGYTDEEARIYVYTHATLYYYELGELDPDNFLYYNHSLETNPFTLTAWTWDEIDALIAGIGLKGHSPNGRPRCTQYFIEVTYETITNYTNKEQETTSYTAYNGLKSFYHNEPLNRTYEYGTYLTNASIRIDIDFLEIFPRSIDYYILSNSNTYLKLVLGSTTYLLDTQTNGDRFKHVSYYLDRQDYLLNETYSTFYFEITYNTNDTSIYLDDLKIIYNDLRPTFEPSLRTWTGTDLDDYVYDYTNTYLNFTSAGGDNFNDDNQGIVYNVSSNYGYTKKVGIDYNFLSNDEIEFSKLDLFYINQTTVINLDKNYVVFQGFYIYPEFTTQSFEVRYYCNVWADGNLRKTFAEWVASEYINKSIDFSFSSNIYQETEESVHVSASYDNRDSGNSSSFIDFSFKIDDNIPKNTLMMMNINSWMTLRHAVGNPAGTAEVSGVFYVQRTLKHDDSESQPVVPPVIKTPNFSLALKIIFFPVYITYIIVSFAISIYHVIATLTNLFAQFKSVWEGYTGGFGDSLTDIIDNGFLTNLGNINNQNRDAFENIPELSDWGAIYNLFHGGDYSNINGTIGGLFPNLFNNNGSIITNNEGMFFGLFNDMLGGAKIGQVWINIYKIISVASAFLTILIILYLISVLKRLLNGEFRSVFNDIKILFSVIWTAFKSVVWIINFIIEIVKWLIDMVVTFVGGVIP